MAPENACCAPPELQLSNFEEVWQYGSNEKTDYPWKQDGVAPQCAIPMIEDDLESYYYGRRYIPDDEIKDFIGSHSGKNHVWIITKIENDDRGYIKQR